MPTYLMLTTLTPQGVQTLKANPSRLREVPGPHTVQRDAARA